MKKYIEPAIKRIVAEELCNTGMPEISINNQQSDEGGFADEYNIFEEEESDAYNKNIRFLNVWER